MGRRFDRDIVAMSWTERNKPPVSQPERRGFGSTVAESMAERTLGARSSTITLPRVLGLRRAPPRCESLMEQESTQKVSDLVAAIVRCRQEASFFQ
jgi:hypothetical protein